MMKRFLAFFLSSLLLFSLSSCKASAPNETLTGAMPNKIPEWALSRTALGEDERPLDETAGDTDMETGAPETSSPEDSNGQTAVDFPNTTAAPDFPTAEPSDGAELRSRHPADPAVETEPIEPAEASILMIGDMLMHTPVSNRTIQADGSYDYSFLFENVLDDISSADLAIVNNEVVMGGNELGLQNYPNFNVRTELGDAEIEAGFDVTLCATNHTLDMGTQGAHNLIYYWEEHPEMLAVGANETPEDYYTIKTIERNGITFAIFNFTYGLNGYEYSDGFSNEPYLVNILWPSRREEIGFMIRKANEFYDFVIVCPHWGDEYTLTHNEEQRSWAEWFVENGADLIIGTHSHCLQDFEIVTVDNGNSAPCFYSLGNFVSSQSFTYSLLGGMAKVKVRKDENGTYITGLGLTPVVTHFIGNFEKTYVYKLSQYSNRTAYFSGAFEYGEQYNLVKEIYPLSVETFNDIIDMVGLRPYIVD